MLHGVTWVITYDAYAQVHNALQSDPGPFAEPSFNPSALKASSEVSRNLQTITKKEH